MSRHHHLSITLLLAIPLIGCSVISGSSAPSGTKAPHTSNVADSYDKVTEMPVSLRNMKKLGEKIDAELTRLEESTSSGTSPGRDISFCRTNLISYYGYGQKGGSEDCEACKNHPAYPGLKDNYSRLDARLRALELRYYKCTYGYQMSNGDILKPTYDWSAEEWASIRTKSKHQTSRCWLNGDLEHYN